MTHSEQVIETFYNRMMAGQWPPKKQKAVQASATPSPVKPARPKRLNRLEIQAAIKQKMAEIKNSKQLKFS